MGICACSGGGADLLAGGRQLVGVKGQGVEVVGEGLQVADLPQHGHLFLLKHTQSRVRGWAWPGSVCGGGGVAWRADSPRRAAAATRSSRSGFAPPPAPSSAPASRPPPAGGSDQSRPAWPRPAEAAGPRDLHAQRSSCCSVH